MKTNQRRSVVPWLVDRKLLAVSAVALLLAGVVVGLLLRGGPGKAPGSDSAAPPAGERPPSTAGSASVSGSPPVCPEQEEWIDFFATRPSVPPDAADPVRPPLLGHRSISHLRAA